MQLNFFTKRVLLFLFFSTFSVALKSQNYNEPRQEDSLLNVIKTLTDNKEIYKTYKKIAQMYLGVSKEKEATYIAKALFTAEQTRDRAFIAKACLDMVSQWSDLGGIIERYDNAITIANKGIDIAKEAQLNDYVALLLTKKAMLYRSKTNYQEAIKYNEEALNYADLSNSDSIRIVAEMSYANTLIAKDENLAAFKKYMSALYKAEEINDDKLKLYLYNRLADFYAKIDQQEKAKDYYTKTIEYSKKLKDENVEIQAYSSLIFLYAEAKDFTNAREYLNILKKAAAKSNNDFVKGRPEMVEVNLLFREDITKVAQYLRSNPKIINDLKQWGYEEQADVAFAILYSLENKKDSAEYYFAKSKKAMLAKSDISAISQWNNSYAMHLEKQNKFAEAAKYLEENVMIADKIQSLSLKKNTLQELDSLYIKSGNVQKLTTTKLLFYQVTDSLNKQQKAKDLLNIEIDMENKRNERLAAEKEEKLRNKHNLQYMGISAAIIALFIGLAGLGKLKVKPIFIRALGFVSFILLFEFIILLIDKPIHHLTHGEPLPILLIKIVIIGILLPLHHWLEHKVIHYLMSHRVEKLTELKN
jgi:hypothetical protein